MTFDALSDEEKYLQSQKKEADLTSTNYQLTDLQQKIVEDMSKSESRPVEQCVNMLISDGLDFYYCEHIAPYGDINAGKYDKELGEAIKEDWK
tara:strand:+ start:363 stop:641 length:279 start_codon:yes stop_codon:yes gene_type:complete